MPLDDRPPPAAPLPAPPPAAPGPARMPVALLGAGQIGRMHVLRMQQHADVMLAGVADPSPAARDWAATLGVPWAADAGELLDRVRPRAALVATPNQLHRPVALACIERGIVPLVEKPIADTVEAAAQIAAAARTAGVPVLVGHQRRHNAIVQRARRLIADGAIGRPVAISLLAAWLKPDSYFTVAWRREKGGGPVLINAIHDIDLLRHLVGEVVSVQAMASRARRGFEVEDTAAAVLRLAGDALATLLVTDSAVSPWNYDLASGESELYARQAVDALFIAGTAGALALPQGNVWRYLGEGGAARHWHGELTQQRTPVHHRDPYAEQLRHLRAVAEGREAPLCSAEDGLATLRATLAVLGAAASGRPVDIDAAGEVHNPAS